MNRQPPRFLFGQIASGALLVLAFALAWKFTPGAWEWNGDPQRLAVALMALMAFAVACLRLAVRRRRRRSIPLQADALPVLFASQTGQAEAIARRSAASLTAAGVAAMAMPLARFDAAALARMRRALFVVSTTGEGDAPDAVAGFVARVLGASASLQGLEYGLLALGDRRYDNFCAFGRRLDAWLREQGAQALFPAIDVDDMDEVALGQWQQQLAQLAGASWIPFWRPQPFHEFRIVERRELNPGSLGEPVFHIELAPMQGELPMWRAGDIAQIVPGPAMDDGAADRHPRDYSIASVPAEGRVHLLLRQGRRPDGELGLGAKWLTVQATPEDVIALRIRANPNFHVPPRGVPLILIGNGTGIAALRALLCERIAQGEHRNWLLFGERQRERDFYYRENLESWLRDGSLSHLDLAFSRDAGDGAYVQQRLREQVPRLQQWLAQGAHLMVCGSQQGMAGGVDATLRELLGDETVLQLVESGRYRRDVY
jgi:sulfite reductase (NADPH) flavoprotein alpha-component